MERLRIPRDRKSESAITLAACSTCDPVIISRSSDPWRVFVLAMRMGSRGKPLCEAPGALVGHSWAYRDVLNDGSAALLVVRRVFRPRTLLVRAP
ncbi:hypothetical protein CDL15_Pgr022799 [Punica granatum]|uniref:Uncharacterized protein n=1 Tax=Punica granatum TaxID=22663 RepID=A0A218XCY7_PUNGR|nr:hypothetical protein CDL15_Pgr022799 [Punica granatum]